MQTVLAVGSERVTFNCSDELHTQADALAGLLRRLAADRGASFFVPGKTIQFGWSLLTLVRGSGELQLHEPDFDANPFAATRNDLSATLTVVAAQAHWTNLLKVDPVEVDFRDRVYAMDGFRETTDIFLQRMAPGEEETNPPWAMKLVTDPRRDGQWNWMFVYALIRFRPWYLPFLALPVGYIVVFKKDKLDAILDPTNRVVYTD